MTYATHHYLLLFVEFFSSFTKAREVTAQLQLLVLFCLERTGDRHGQDSLRPRKLKAVGQILLKQRQTELFELNSLLQQQQNTPLSSAWRMQVTPLKRSE